MENGKMKPKPPVKCFQNENGHKLSENLTKNRRASPE